MVYFIGVDVGTGSARAAVVDENGVIIATRTMATKTWNPEPEYYQQSSQDIWEATCSVVRSALHDSKVDRSLVKGMAFDATCSLVVLNEDREPVTIDKNGDEQQNIILWMDHRAIAEAARINETHHKVLNMVGGVISPEMETPKLLWLKKNLPESYKCGHYFMDLADFLVFKATGYDVRSKCTTICKWTYIEETGWDREFFSQIGLDDLGDRIGAVIEDVGKPVGMGLCPDEGENMGLPTGITVSSGLIDAHAGGIGLIGGENICENMAIISGTSTCHMSLTRKPVFVDGCWGPYPSAMVPEYVLCECGQSATGALLDSVIDGDAEGCALRAVSDNVYTVLNTILEGMCGTDRIDHLTSDIHVLPDFHGNRSPLANPTIRGMVSGLSLDHSPESLAVLYLAAVQALAYGTKRIIEAVNEKRVEVGEPVISRLIMCGGLSKNPVFVQMHANICQMPIALPKEVEAVLIGASISAAVASGYYKTFKEAMSAMDHVGSIVHPQQDTFQYHVKKFEVLFEGTTI